MSCVFHTCAKKNKWFFSETNLVSKACKGLELFLNEEGLKSARFKASCPPQGVYSSLNSLVNRNEALVDEKIDRVHKLTNVYFFQRQTWFRKLAKVWSCFSMKKASNQPVSKLHALLRVSTPR